MLHHRGHPAQVCAADSADLHSAAHPARPDDGRLHRRARRRYARRDLHHGDVWHAVQKSAQEAGRSVNKESKSVDEVLNILNKKSGVLGISDVSSDFRDLEAAAEEGNERAKLALDMFIYRVIKYIGAYAAAMNGVDAIVFTAGIGENTVIIRDAVAKGLSYLGVKLDEKVNSERRKDERYISTPDSKVKLLVIPTNEELMIAQDTARLVSEK